MNVIYLSDPEWYENAISIKAISDSDLLLTDSDKVFTEAIRRNMNVQCTSHYISSDIIIHLRNETLNLEKILIKSIANLMETERYFSEVMRGSSDFIFEVQKKFIALSEIFQKHTISKITFFVGDHFFANIGETPRAAWIEYIILQTLCKENNVKFKTKFLKFDTTKFFLMNNNVFQKHYFINTPLNNRIQENIKRKNFLFLYHYEACFEDLYPLYDFHRKNDKVSIKSGCLTKNAPKSIVYDLDFSDTAEESHAEISKINKNFNSALDKIPKNLLFKNINNESLIKKLFLIFRKNLNSSLLQSCNSVFAFKFKTKSIVFDEIIMTAYPSPVTFVLAAYMIHEKYSLTLRQHGCLGEPYWVVKNYLSGCNFSVNSIFYRNQLSQSASNVSIMARTLFLTKKTEENKPKEKKYNIKNIIILDNIFLNPANKSLYNIFFKDFISKSPKNWIFTLRTHPRYPGNLIPNFSERKIIMQDSREIYISDALVDASIVICSADTMSSAICEAIALNIPVFLVRPKAAINTFDFKPYALKFPCIIRSPRTLINKIGKILLSRAYREDYLIATKSWSNSIVGPLHLKQVHLKEAPYIRIYFSNNLYRHFQMLKIFARSKIKILFIWLRLHAI